MRDSELIETMEAGDAPISFDEDSDDDMLEEEFGDDFGFEDDDDFEEETRSIITPDDFE